MPVIKVRVSERGLRKISVITKLIERSVKKSLKEGVELYMLPEAAKKAPSYEEEKMIIIEGISAEGEKIGYHYQEEWANTFIEYGRPSLRQAIWDDYVEIFSDGNFIKANTGHTQEINEKTKLRYFRKAQAGGLHISYPFNSKFLESIEFGGTWEVKPREYSTDNKKGPKLLRPEPDITTATMFKSTDPYRMYRRALHSNKVRRQIRTLILKDLKGTLKHGN